MIKKTFLVFAEEFKENILFSLFLISAWIGPAISYSHIYLFHVVMVFLFPTWAYRAIKDIRHINLRYSSKYYLFFLYTLVWFIISLLWTPDFIVGWKYLFYIVNGIFIALAIIFFADSKRELVIIFNISSVVIIIELLLSLLEVFTPFRLPVSRNSYLLPYFGRELFLTPDLLQCNYLDYMLSMPTGFHFNPNTLSAVLCILFPFFLLSKNKWIGLIGAISIVILVVASGARICFYSLCFIYVLYCLIYADKKKVYPYLIGIIFSIIITDGYYFFPLQNLKIHEIALVSKSKFTIQAKCVEETKSARKELFYRGINIIKETNGLGAGSGSVEAIISKNGGVGRSKLINLHFYWLEIIVNGGVLYGILFFLWYVSIMWKNLKISIFEKEDHLKYFSSSSFLALCGFTIAAIAPSSCVYLFPMYILFGFSIAVINVSLKKNENTSII